VNKKNDNKP